jgi:hypothetical protein
MFGINASPEFFTLLFGMEVILNKSHSSLGSMQEANRQLNRGLVDVGAIGS